MAPLDRATVEDLYRRYGFQVERRCRRILGGVSDAADAAQEVFVKVLTRGGDVRGTSEWTTWLYRVATNVCLNRLRDLRTRDVLLRQHAHEVTPSAVPPPDGNIDRHIMTELLAELDETTREIVVYHLIDEMPQGEIAALIGLSRVTVNKRLMKFRARCEERTQEGLPGHRGRMV
jgi:RNA polymerase sigma factor (sigma-70 family)